MFASCHAMFRTSRLKTDISGVSCHPAEGPDTAAWKSSMPQSRRLARRALNSDSAMGLRYCPCRKIIHLAAAETISASTPILAVQYAILPESTATHATSLRESAPHQRSRRFRRQLWSAKAVADCRAGRTHRPTIHSGTSADAVNASITECAGRHTLDTFENHRARRDRPRSIENPLDGKRHCTDWATSEESAASRATRVLPICCDNCSICCRAFAKHIAGFGRRTASPLPQRPPAVAIQHRAAKRRSRSRAIRLNTLEIGYRPTSAGKHHMVRERQRASRNGFTSRRIRESADMR
jgi:hypothetical protein